MSVPCPGSGNQPARGPNRAARRAKNLHTMTVTDYERERQERIAKNKAILAALDIPKAINSTPKRVARISPKKRKRRDSDVDGGSSVKAVDKPPLVRRTSARLQNIPRRTYDESDDEKPKQKANSDFESEDEVSDGDEEDFSDEGIPEDDTEEKRKRKTSRSTSTVAPGLARRTVNGRNVAHISKSFDRPNPKTFGSIEGVPNGKWWSTRMEASRDGCHAPTVAGISGNEKEGCWSIALSGGYEDDVDEGYCFTYTGSGGRDLKGTKSNPKNLRTAPQSADQTLTGLNLALKVSCDTGKPVRVIRGFKGHSKWAPSEGYDGLYKVVKHWAEKGMAGFLVMKYAFVRVEGQSDIRLDIRTSEDAENIES